MHWWRYRNTDGTLRADDVQRGYAWELLLAGSDGLELHGALQGQY